MFRDNLMRYRSKALQSRFRQTTFAPMIAYCLTRSLVGLFWLIPFRAMYVLSDGLSWLLYRVVGYRRQVVLDNLRRCFPDKSAQELDTIARESYRNLTDIMLESVKGASTSLPELYRRYQYRHYEVVNNVLAQGRSVVLAGAHYSNWEWGVLTIGRGIEGATIGVYKPLSNARTDAWFFKNRSRDGYMILKSMKDTFQAVEDYRDRPTVFILVADQMPSNKKTAIRVQFFGQTTACLPGTEAIAVKNNYPVLMYEIQRIRRGHYELSFSEVNLQPAGSAPGEVTQQIMSKIEATIRGYPANWLWSHRRWKWV
jgi:Kdo2-lipid IVA lauroyltransferase/acyltransferase